jgi:lipoprotein-anchoring transpeptidase ErfK/SrfK
MHRWFDLSYGCIMLTNKEIDELYSHTKIGTAIEILP